MFTSIIQSCAGEIHVFFFSPVHDWVFKDNFTGLNEYFAPMPHLLERDISFRQGVELLDNKLHLSLQ